MANIDKVKLEQIIDRYLNSEIPLAYLMDEYKLSFPQMKLLINRVKSFNRKIDDLYNNYPNASYNNVADSFVVIPHEIEEEYPFDKDKQISLFQRLDEIKESIPTVSIDLIRIIDNEINECLKSLEEFDQAQIAKAEKIAEEIANMQISGDDFEDIFRRNFITIKDFQYLNQMYTEYLQIKENINILNTKKMEAEKDLKTTSRLKREMEDIRTNLVTHNIKLVNYCTRYFFSGILLPQDEVQLYGIEGLIIAINRFDYKQGYQFSSYAVPIIVHNIQKYFKEMIGINWEDFCHKESIRYYRDWYKKEIGFDMEISPRTLAETGLVPLTEKAIASNDKLNRAVSLSDVQESFEDENNFGLRDYPATFTDYQSLDDYTDATEIGIDSLEKDFISKYVQSTLIEVLKTLTAREAQILILRFGLVDGKERTLDEVGRIFHLSGEWVRQIQSKALRKLRHPRRIYQLRGLLSYYDEMPTDELPSLDNPKRL